MGRALFWISCAIALAAFLFGLFNVWVSFKLMFASKPTGATLTFAFYALPWLSAGVGIFLVTLALRYFLRKKK